MLGYHLLPLRPVVGTPVPGIPPRQTRTQHILNAIFKSWEGRLIQTYLAVILLVD